jgi:hypothetical protein
VRTVPAIAAVLLLVSQQLYSGREPDFSKIKPDFDTPDVSLVSLIANPEKFHGKYIRTKGVAYFHSIRAINAIFLTREDKRCANSANAIFLEFGPSIRNPDKLNDKFVGAQGIFGAHDHGHLGYFPASLVKVDRVEAITADIK